MLAGGSLSRPMMSCGACVCNCTVAQHGRDCLVLGGLWYEVTLAWRYAAGLGVVVRGEAATTVTVIPFLVSVVGSAPAFSDSQYVLL